MNRRQNAVLFKRQYTKKNGKKSTWYWYYVYNENGKRKAFSLYTQSRTDAKHLLDEKKASGELIPPTGDTLPLQDFAEPYFTLDRCPYVQMKRLRGERITLKTINQNRSYLDNHIVPALGTQALGSLTPVKIEAFLLSLKDGKQLANKTINNVLSCLRILTGEALRAGHIKDDPAKKVRPLHAGNGKRGILTPEEVKSILSQPNKWRSLAAYAINLTAATTGARLSELRALKTRNVQEDRIIIDGVIREGEGYIEGDTKTGESGLRVIPIPKITQAALAELATGKEAEAFVFSLDGGKKPLGANVATRALHDALTTCAVMDGDEQKKRVITFHSWRHFFNSIMRGRVSENDLRHVVGHTTEEMTERYSHRLPEHIERFAEAQERAIDFLTAKQLMGGSESG